jgi:hypothetical protein
MAKLNLLTLHTELAAAFAAKAGLLRQGNERPATTWNPVLMSQGRLLVAPPVPQDSVDPPSVRSAYAIAPRAGRPERLCRLPRSLALDTTRTLTTTSGWGRSESTADRTKSALRIPHHTAAKAGGHAGPVGRHGEHVVVRGPVTVAPVGRPRVG